MWAEVFQKCIRGKIDQEEQCYYMILWNLSDCKICLAITLKEKNMLESWAKATQNILLNLIEPFW